MPDFTPDQLEQLQSELATTKAALEEARQTITALERRQKIDALLAESDAIDIEVARLLTEAAVASMSEPDVQAAIEDLRRHKPWLFRRRPPAAADAMSPHLPDTAAHAHEAAQQALATGHRRDLLAYLRLRRGKVQG